MQMFDYNSWHETSPVTSNNGGKFGSAAVTSWVNKKGLEIANFGQKKFKSQFCP